MILWFAIAPLAVLIPVPIQACWPTLGRSIAGLGILTYAVYLVHFPLQLVIMVLGWHLRYVIEVTGSVLVGYFTVHTLISWFVFHRFGAPSAKQ